MANRKYNTSVLFGVLLFSLSIFLHSCQDCFAEQYTSTYTFFSGSTFWRTQAQTIENKYGLMRASLVLSSLQFSHSVVSNSLKPMYARPPCPSPTLSIYPNSCPLSQWCHPTISSSVVPFFSCLQSFPVSGSFPMSQFFTSGGQSIGVSASTSVLPINTQDLSPLEWNDLL